MARAINIYCGEYLRLSQEFDLTAMILGRMARVLDVTLETIRLEACGDLGAGEIALTLYPLDKDGKVRLDAGVEVRARVIGRSAGSNHLAFKTSIYPLSKLIIRCLAARQGLEPYHAKIGL